MSSDQLFSTSGDDGPLEIPFFRAVRDFWIPVNKGLDSGELVVTVTVGDVTGNYSRTSRSDFIEIMKCTQ